MRSAFLILIAAALAVFAACSQQAAAPGEAETGTQEEAKSPEEILDELMADWLALEDEARLNLMTTLPEDLCMQMHFTKPDGHLQVVEVLEDPDSSEDLVALAVGSLQALADLDEDGALLINRVEKLVDSGMPAKRAGALQLLAVNGKPEYRKYFEANRGHEDRRVRIAAYGGLARLGEKEATKKLIEIYNNEETRPLERDRAAFEISRSPELEDLGAMEDALVRRGITPGTRAMVIEALGRFGNAWHISLLEKYEKENLLTESQSANIDAALEKLRKRGADAVEEALEEDAGGASSISIQMHPVAPAAAPPAVDPQEAAPGGESSGTPATEEAAGAQTPGSKPDALEEGGEAL